MKKDYMNFIEVLKKIQKEGGVIEDIEVDEYTEDIDINAPKNRKFKPLKLKKAVVGAMLGLTIVAGTNVSTENIANNVSGYTVEAKTKKKDKKKPVIKVSGKTKMTVEQGKSVKIPKVTAKDNVDGNVTKKIKITVKKGKTSYKSIAAKIKKGKKVKFTKTGKYIVTYTVTDKAGNKATKKRYITVKKAQEDKPTPYDLTTTEEPTTEVPTTEAPTTEAPTTEAPTTEAPTTEEQVQGPVVGDGKYEINKATVGDKTYNIVNDADILTIMGDASSTNENITLNFENYYSQMMFQKELLADHSYLIYFGAITAKDKNGKDISDKIVIYESISTSNPENNAIIIYVTDDFGNILSEKINIALRKWRSGYNYDDYTFTGWKMVSKDPIVYADPRHYDSNGNLITNSSKTLQLVK